ncbi:MAG TPA: enoyl-CoA hydratase/isomerase family protein [Pyrinomonadaceae bacterium]|jgi:enoyl-CoA hydratase/carnithine racemase
MKESKEREEEVSRPRAVLIETRSQSAIIRFNRPAARNTLSAATLDELDNALAELDSLPRIKAVIFTGSGDVFASGADIKELMPLDSPSARAFAERGQRLMQRIADSSCLTIAAVNGYCMGGGLDLALACRFRVATPASVFAHPGARLGIITGWGGTQRLPRLVGPTRALEMFLTARRVTSEEALEMGLIDRLCDSALAGALEIAESLVR